MQYIIHIGTTKTGSKALQHTLRENSETLKRKRIIYPETGRRGVWHHGLFDGTQKEIMPALIAEAKGFETCIISYEGAYSLPDNTLKWLKMLPGRKIIVVFVRNQVGWINSFYNQLHKAHRRPMRDILDFEKHIPSKNPEFDLDFQIARWERFFGIENVFVFKHSKEHHPAVPVLNLAGLIISDQDDIDLSKFNPNKAADIRSLKILRYIKKRISSEAELPHVIRCAHKSLRGSWIDTRHEPAPMLLCDDDVMQIREVYSAGNSSLIQRHGLPSDIFDADVGGDLKCVDLDAVFLRDILISEKILVRAKIETWLARLVRGWEGIYSRSARL